MFGATVFELVNYAGLPPLIPFSDSDDYEDMPPLISGFGDFIRMIETPMQSTQSSSTIKRDNPILDIMVGWEDVDVDYIQKVAIAHFREDRPKEKLNYRETQAVVLKVLKALRRQCKQPTVLLPACCESSSCSGSYFVDCVLDACKDVFLETEFF